MWYALVEQQRYWLRTWSELARQVLSAWPASTLPHVAAAYFVLFWTRTTALH